MSPHISIVIPAYQEEGRVGRTVRTLRRALAERPDLSWELTVVDDGSVDKTAFEAGREGARVLRLPRNAGKGAALLAGFQEATGSVLVMVDADVVETADQALLLLEPILGGRADMAVGAFQRPPGL
ncbi:MAG: glycosyltransferase family 2 protein, partial [Armatimonadetes bacterium]|nr:glycosyltransferase family 2 protein [Armatimonadota bacterium]